jgi:hypothetical protein
MSRSVVAVAGLQSAAVAFSVDLLPFSMPTFGFAYDISVVAARPSIATEDKSPLENIFIKCLSFESSK